jgi:hypothetical protein
MKEKQLQNLQRETIENLQRSLGAAFDGYLKEDTIRVMKLLIEDVVLNTFYGYGIPAFNHTENKHNEKSIKSTIEV